MVEMELMDSTQFSLEVLSETLFIKGEPGKAPVRGVDYWTEEDKQQIVTEVLAALPVYGGEVEDV